MDRCRAMKKDGTPCPVEARPSGYCWVHDPELAVSRSRGRRQGGKTRSRPAATLPADTPDLLARTVGDVVALLGTTINETRRGVLDHRIANAVGYLSSVLLRALQDSDLAAQVAELRRELEELKRDESQHARRDQEDAGGDPVPKDGYGWDPGPAAGGPDGDPDPGGGYPGLVAGDVTPLF
jgi:hypothetical protein